MKLIQGMNTMKKSWIIKLLLSLSFALLASCATTPRPTTTALTWPQREAQLNAIQSWTLHSSFSVYHANQLSIASLTWQQQGKYFKQRVAGPFNLGGVRIEGQPGRVTMYKSAQQQFTASTPEELLQDQLGLYLPVSNLYYWVRGLPAPGPITSQQFDANHHLSNLQQSGWTIQYPSYINVNGVDLPNKILLSNSDYQVKLIIKQWII